MKKLQVLIVAHADADGHVIAEQARRNLSRVSSFEVTTVVDPERTKNHKAWTRLDELTEVADKDIICFLDMMFAPNTFVEEASALVAFAKARSNVSIFVLDHHPLPLGRLAEAENIHAVYREDVLDCTIGPRTRMMIAAALNETQPTRASNFKDSLDDDIATGLHRAAALGGPLPGEKLCALLRANCWGGLAELGREDKSYHDLPRGRRRQGDDKSKTIRALNEVAETLLRSGTNGATTSRIGKFFMAYDDDHYRDHTNHSLVDVPVIQASGSRDLETIVSLLEMAAISITTVSKPTFTRDELLREARKYGGNEITLEDTDVDLVISKAGFLKKESGKRLRLK